MGTQLPRKKETHPQFRAHVYSGQTAGWIKRPLGTEIGLGPTHPPKKVGTTPLIFGPCLCRLRHRQHCVRWLPSSSPPEKGTSPNFRSMSIVANGWIDQDARGRLQPREHCVRWLPSSPPIWKGHSPQFRPMSIVVKRSPISATADLLLNVGYTCPFYRFLTLRTQVIVPLVLDTSYKLVVLLVNC